MEISETGNWLIDELIPDPHFFSSGCVIKDKDQYYFIRFRGTEKNTVEPLANYKDSPAYERAHFNHDYFMHGVEPRTGYTLPEVGRAITADEFTELTNRLELTDDDISDEFTETKGGLYGPKAQVSITVKQIKTKIAGDAIPVESELREKGIEAFSSNAGRVNIRVK
jgi:hypothetical protein